MMPSSEDTATEPMFTCDFCKGKEDELTTSKKHCESVNKKLPAKVVNRESLHNDDIKVQYIQTCHPMIESYAFSEVGLSMITSKQSIITTHF